MIFLQRTELVIFKLETLNRDSDESPNRDLQIATGSITDVLTMAQEYEINRSSKGENPKQETCKQDKLQVELVYRKLRNSGAQELRSLGTQDKD